MVVVVLQWSQWMVVLATTTPKIKLQEIEGLKGSQSTPILQQTCIDHRRNESEMQNKRWRNDNKNVHDSMIIPRRVCQPPCLSISWSARVSGKENSSPRFSWSRQYGRGERGAEEGRKMSWRRWNVLEEIPVVRGDPFGLGVLVSFDILLLLLLLLLCMLLLTYIICYILCFIVCFLLLLILVLVYYFVIFMYFFLLCTQKCDCEGRSKRS